MAVLQYVDAGRVNPGVVTERDTVWHLNSVFDPYVTGAGHQPREFDTWATVYNKYRVMKTRYELWIRQRASHGVIVVVVPNTVATALTSADYPAELPRAEVLGTTGSSQPPLHGRGSFMMNAILGQTDTQYRANENTAALVTTDPGELLYLHLFVAQLDAATVLDIEYELRLTYEVEFFERKVIGPSALIRQSLGINLPRAPDDDDDVAGPTAPGGGAPASAFPRLASSSEVHAAAAAVAARDGWTRVYPAPKGR